MLLKKFLSEMTKYNGNNALEVLTECHRTLKYYFTYLSDDIQYATEMEIRNIYDIWRMGIINIKTVEDCDGFGAKLIHMIEELGVPKNKIYMVNCRYSTGEGHFVTFVKDENGMLWWACNIVDSPVPAWYMFHALGCTVDQYSNLIMRLDKKGDMQKIDIDRLPNPTGK